MARSTAGICSADSNILSRTTIPSGVSSSPPSSLVSFPSKNPRYDQTLIRVMVVVAYLGWAAYGATTILSPNSPPTSSVTISGVALAALATSWTLFAVQKYPSTFYVYVVFPCYFWREVLVTSSSPLLELYRSGRPLGSVKLFFRAVFVIAALQSMVVRILMR